MRELPEAVLGLPSLRALWLENNPLEGPASEADHHLALGPALKNVGLDQHQARLGFKSRFVQSST